VTGMVEDYTNKFHELSIRSRVSETECQTIARYRVRLLEDIRKDLLTVRLVSIEEAYQLALRLEQQSWGSHVRRNVQYQGRSTLKGNSTGGSQAPPAGVDHISPQPTPNTGRGDTAPKLEGSQLPVCVIRRALAGKRMEECEEEDWLRSNIFHTRVEHKRKALNLIIDNGSGMNIVS